MLFPIQKISGYLNQLIVTGKRIEELEISLSTLIIENEELKKKLPKIEDTTSLKGIRLLKANIIGRDPANFNGFLYIDKGSNDSIYLNQPVVIAGKLVGRIKSFTQGNGIVETLERPGFAISGFDTKTGIYGIIRKNRQLKFDYVKKDDEIFIGDTIFTSGLSETFPPGIIIGFVEKIGNTEDLFFKEVILRPAVSVNKLSYVYLLFLEEEKPSEKPVKKFVIPEELRKLRLSVPEMVR